MYAKDIDSPVPRVPLPFTQSVAQPAFTKDIDSPKAKVPLPSVSQINQLMPVPLPLAPLTQNEYIEIARSKSEILTRQQFCINTIIQKAISHYPYPLNNNMLRS